MGPKLCIMMAMCWIFLLVSLGPWILSPGSISSLPLARPPSRLRDWWSWRESERHLAGGGLGIWDGGLDRGLLACLSRPLGDWFPYISIQSLMLLKDFDRFWETQTLSGTPQTLSNSLKLSQNLSQTLSKPLKHKLNPAFWLVWGGFMVDISKKIQKNSKKIQKNSKFSRNPFHHHRFPWLEWVVRQSWLLVPPAMAPPSILSAAAISKPVKRKAQAMEFVGMEIDHSDSHHESWWICESEEFWRTLDSASLSLILVPVVNYVHCLVGFKVALTYMYACAILYHPKSLHDNINNKTNN